MAIMVDLKPSDLGDAKVWQAFQDGLKENAVVYYKKKIDSSVIDFTLLLENDLIIVIKVSSWQKELLEIKSKKEIQYDGVLVPSPKEQSRSFVFSFVNGILEKINENPLVKEMICYPFIYSWDYAPCRLGILSGKDDVLFADDLESPEAFYAKIQNFSKKWNHSGHCDLDSARMQKIREYLEPDAGKQMPNSNQMPYSALYILPNRINDAYAAQIIRDYCSGIKTILFVHDQDSFHSVLSVLDQALHVKNLEPSGGELQIGYRCGVRNRTADVFRMFNFELYYVPVLPEKHFENMAIMDGICDSETVKLMAAFAQKTGFNFQQYQIEHACAEHNILVQAGAGTGKTYSMVSRIAFLCNRCSGAVNNIAEEIAMVTFTNDAADNMKKRIKRMFMNYFLLTNKKKYLQFIEQIDQANIMTIHKFVLNILKGSSFYTGLGVNFKVTMDAMKRREFYRKRLAAFFDKKMEENPNFINEFPVAVYDFQEKIMEFADNLLAKSIDLLQIQPNELGVPIEGIFPYFNEVILKVIVPAETEYLASLHEINGMDLKEAIIVLNRVLRADTAVLAKYKLRFLFIDEFQDTDDVQIDLFVKLQKALRNQCRLFVVGDLKQSIYRFRGATLSAFERLLENKLYVWETYHLNTNYRTDHRLLDAFDEVFSRMGSLKYLPYQREDRLTSPICLEHNSDFLTKIDAGKDESAFYDTVIDAIRQQYSIVQKLMSKCRLSQEERTIAILVRNNWQVERIVQEAEQRGLFGIQTNSGGDLYKLQSTLDLYRLVLALANNQDPVYLVNLIESNYVGLRLDYSVYRGMTSEEKQKDLTRILNQYFLRIMGCTWEQIIASIHSQPILYTLRRIYEAAAPWDRYADRNERALYAANYEYLMEKVIRHTRMDAVTLNSIEVFLKINVLTGQKEMSRTIEGEDDEIKVTCLTIHKSKGLEYGTVILPFTQDDISASKKNKLEVNYSDSKLSYTLEIKTGRDRLRERNSYYNEFHEQGEQIKEECRILYVAMTRAIRKFVWVHNTDSHNDPSWAALLGED